MARMIIVGLCLIVAAAFGSALHAADTPLLWASDGLTKVLRSDLPPQQVQPLQVSGARGETVSVQAVLRTTSDVASVSCAITDLRHAEMMSQR